MKSIALNNPLSKHLTRLLFFGFLVFLVACTPRMTINVNAIVDASQTMTNKHYIWVSDNEHIDENDLYFKEFSRYFQQILKVQGYQKVDNSGDADLEIRFKYAVSDGRTGFQSYYFPVYAYVGGESITVVTTTTDSSGGTTKETQTVRIPGYSRYVGTQVENRQFTLYNRTAALKAVSLVSTETPAKKLDQTDVEKTIWQLMLYNVSESDDLRQALPFFAVAAGPFIGKNTGQNREVVIEETDTRVQMLKQLTTPTP